MSDEPGGRRDFFRELARRLVEPAVDYLEDLGGPEGKEGGTVLRPPGALPESVFTEMCRRCHACVEACPAEAIRPLEVRDERRRGTPVIVPGEQPCVVCDDLACMSACPSGALQRLTVDDFRIGLAEVDGQTCVRSEGEDCTRCVEACPIGRKAIHLDGEGAVEVTPACVGCGVCESECPTRPRAIVVKPPSG